MKRLTIYRNGALEINCENCPETKICKSAEFTESDCLYFLTERLAEYEDIGLEPEKIVFLKNVVDDAFSDKPEFTEHVRELLRAEKDGRLVILPCKLDKEE